MDLGTINNKLRDARYDFVEEVLDDLQLVWDNCKTYNPPDTVEFNQYSGFIKRLKILKEHIRKWLKITFLTPFNRST